MSVSKRIFIVQQDHSHEALNYFSQTYFYCIWWDIF